MHSNQSFFKNHSYEQNTLSISLKNYDGQIKNKCICHKANKANRNLQW